MSGIALVTGASGDIGTAIASLLAKRGCAVAIHYSSGEQQAHDLRERISNQGGTAVTVRADISCESDVVAMFRFIDEKLGPVSALVNNAGITGGFARVETVSAATIERVLAVNVTGSILCSREAIRRMSTKHGGHGGAIVNISSIAARLGGAGEWVHYAASKGAIETFTRGLAREVATEGIRVNTVAPGLIDTRLHAAVGDPDRPHRMSPGIPMQRPGTAEEVAEAVAWLLSDAASYVTGTILEVGGGR